MIFSYMTCVSSERKCLRRQRLVIIIIIDLLNDDITILLLKPSKNTNLHVKKANRCHE